jgi:hypothetical protein
VLQALYGRQIATTPQITDMVDCSWFDSALPLARLDATAANKKKIDWLPIPIPPDRQAASSGFGRVSG